MSFNGTENKIQNYCVTFSHTFDHHFNRFTNSFVIKAGEITNDNAVKIAELLFPDFTDIKIESIENDEKTLTPAEYSYISGVLRDKLYSRRRESDTYVETEGDKSLLKLIQKMEARMEQFPVYHS